MKIEKVGLKFKGTLKPIPKVDTIVAHHPAHPSWGIEEIHDSHLKKGWAGAGYNYFVTFDGRVIEGRGKNIGAHCEGHNSHSLGVCFQGNFEVQEMTDKQVEAGGWLIAQLIREYGLSINDIIEHKKMPGAATVCPGRNFRMDDLKQSVLEWTNPNVKKEVAGVIYTDTQPPQNFRLETGNFGTEEDAEKALEMLKQKYSWIIRREGKKLVTGTWTDTAVVQRFKDEWKQTYKWWVYIKEV